MNTYTFWYALEGMGMEQVMQFIDAVVYPLGLLYTLAFLNRLFQRKHNIFNALVVATACWTWVYTTL